MTETRLSVVIPARNEEKLIGEVLEAILASIARLSRVSRHDLWLPDTSFEVIVADDGSDDATADIVMYVRRRIRRAPASLHRRKCAAARNAGAAASAGRVFCFVDADTIVPENAVDRILQLHEEEGSAWCSIGSPPASPDPSLAVVDVLGPGATPPAVEGQVDAGVHEL